MEVPFNKHNQLLPSRHVAIIITDTAIHVIWKASKTSADINYKCSTEVKFHYNRLSLLRLLHMEVAVLRMSVISELTVHIKI